MQYQFKGWKFNHPDFDNLMSSKTGIQPLENGKIAMVYDRESIRQSILLLISTVPGERVMRPKYGCNLQQLAFMPNDATAHGLAIHYIRTALEQWESRISIVSLDADTNVDDPSIIDISLVYKIRSLLLTEQLMIAYHLMGAEI